MEPEQIQAIFDKANDLLEAERPEESLRCLEALEGRLYDSEDRIEYSSLRAWALSECGRVMEAFHELEENIEEFPESSRLYGALGVVFSNEGDLDSACGALEQAVELDEEDEVSLANLGLVYEKLRQYEQALAIYNRAVDLGAEIDWLLKRTAAVQSELGQSSAARATLKRYLSLAPEDADQWITLATMYGDDQEYDQAFTCYRAAEQITPDSARLRLCWGETGVRARRLEVAEQQLRYLKRLAPDSPQPYLLKAFIQEENGDRRQAHRSYIEALTRVDRDDYEELTYALEMAMDFFTRHGLYRSCDQLLRKAYFNNACTVELCEAFREAAGEAVARAHWYSMLLEGDYREGLEEVVEPGDDPRPPAARFLRNYQVIARDHDDALAYVVRFAVSMGESNVQVREFVSEEAISDTRLGVYEIERDSWVFSSNGARGRGDSPLN